MRDAPLTSADPVGLPLRSRWAVVGGGLLGMTIALRLVQSGAEVTLYEAEADLGGLARAWRLGDLLWDRHYHVTLLSDVKARALLRELDLEREMEWVETKTGFFTDGRLHSMSNTIEFLRFPPLRLLDKLRLGGTIFYASRIRDPQRLESESVGSFLRRWSGRRTFERIWLPLLRSKLGDNYSRTSAAFIWATIARMYAARRTGLKKEMFGYVPGGYARILERFAGHLEARGVRLATGCPVERVAPRPDGRVGVGTRGESLPFDQVVVTAPAPLAVRMCPDLTSDEHGRQSGLEYQGIICASVLLKRPLSPYYITNITDSWVPFTAVIEMSSLVDPRHLGGHALVYLPKYVASWDPAFQVSDEVLRSEWLAALSRMHPAFDREDVLAFRVSRVQYVHALPTLGYSQRLPRMRTSLRGIHIVNSSHIVHGTANVNETIGLAERWVAANLGSAAGCGQDSARGGQA